MMGNPRSQLQKVIKYIRNHFRLEKKLNENAIKDIIHLFRLKKKLKELKI